MYMIERLFIAGTHGMNVTAAVERTVVSSLAIVGMTRNMNGMKIRMMGEMV
jgi:hypothetical protein